jgi:hypothetical protein
MTEDELRQLYEAGKEIIRAERRARQFVFRNDPARRKAKVAEMTRLLEMWAAMKDALKPHCEDAWEQPRLLDAPSKADYR